MSKTLVQQQFGQDDGIGFQHKKSPLELARARHFGLLGIVERVQLLDGRLDIESKPNQGTRLRVTVPL